MDIINKIRGFNREYINVIGLMDKYILNTQYTMQEVRVLFEISSVKTCRFSYLKEKLVIDGGYLSRIVKKLEKEVLVQRVAADDDLRAMNLSVTKKGEKLIDDLEKESNDSVYKTIQHLNQNQQSEIVESMENISQLLIKKRIFDEPDGITIREELEAGDLGYLIYLHGKLYRDECGYDLAFEGYVAQTFCDFMKRYNEELDQFYLVEDNGVIVGCIGVVAHSKEEAQLRWFLVLPEYRNKGLGKKIFDKALNYCLENKFNLIWLITTQDQQKAIEMYKKNGFELKSKEPLNFGGKQLVEERYELKSRYARNDSDSIDDFLL